MVIDILQKGIHAYIHTLGTLYGNKDLMQGTTRRQEKKRMSEDIIMG